MRTDQARLHPLPGQPRQATHLGPQFIALLKMEYKAGLMDDTLSTCLKCKLVHYATEFVMRVNECDISSNSEVVEGCPRCHADPEHLARLTTRYAQYLGRRETYLRFKSEGIALRFPLRCWSFKRGVNNEL